MSIDLHNSGLRLKAHRRSVIVTDRRGMRALSTTVRQEQHEAFDALARPRDITHTALLRQIVEAVLRRPELLETMLAPSEKKR